MNKTGKSESQKNMPEKYLPRIGAILIIIITLSSPSASVAQTATNNVEDFQAKSNVVEAGRWAYGWFGRGQGIKTPGSKFTLFEQSYPVSSLKGAANWTPDARKPEIAWAVAADGNTYCDGSEIVWVYKVPASLSGKVYVEGRFGGGASNKKITIYKAASEQFNKGDLSQLKSFFEGSREGNSNLSVCTSFDASTGDVVLVTINDTSGSPAWWIPCPLNISLRANPTSEYFLHALDGRLTTGAGRWTYYTGEDIDLRYETATPQASMQPLEVRGLPAGHALLRETALIGRRRELSKTEQSYLDDAMKQLATSPARVIVRAGDDSKAIVPDTDLPVVIQILLSADGTARIAPMTLPPGVYEVRIPPRTGDPFPIASTLTIRAPLNHRDYLMRGNDLFKALPTHRELFQMPAAGINTIQAHFADGAVGADSLAALGYEGVNCQVAPKADPSWAPAQADGTPGRRQFYNVSFNNKDSMQALSDYVQGPGKAQLIHPFNSTTLTINEVADMVLIDYGAAAREGWTRYLKATYGSMDRLKADWGAQADGSLIDFEGVPMPTPPGGVGGGTFNTHLMMDVEKHEKGKISATSQPDWIRAAWWHWLKFKDLSERDWLAHAKSEYDKAGALASGDKFIHPHHDPGVTFRCNWFLLTKPDSKLFTYDSYNPTWRFGAYFADLASQLHPTPWVMETNKLGGPAPEAAAELYSLYSHGLTGVAFFKWQPYIEGPYSFGLLEKDWKPGDKFAAVASMNRLAAQTAPSLLHLHSERSPVAVVYPHSDLVQNTIRDWSLLQDWHAFYGAFTDRHMVPYIISEEFADKPVPEWIKVVVLSDVTHVGSGVWANLRAWVTNGGTLLLAGRTGEYDRYGRKSSELESFPGYSIGGRQLPKANITADSLAANVLGKGEWFIRNGAYLRTSPKLLDLIPAGDQWVVLRTTNMENIALMERSFVKGRVVVLPWSPGKIFRDAAASTYLRDFFFELLAEEGVLPRLLVSPAGNEFDAVLRTGDKGRAVFVGGANHGKADRFAFTVPAAKDIPMRAFRLNGEGADELELHTNADGATVSFELELRTFEPFAVSLFPVDAKPELLSVTENPNAVEIRGTGIPWTLTVKDSRGLPLARPQHGVGAARAEWPAYKAAKEPVTAELATPLGTIKTDLRKR
ncbi:MAG: hypothetical protein WAX69_17655 [Victivallales bacterium]